jgi:hypothetical protein
MEESRTLWPSSCSPCLFHLTYGVKTAEKGQEDNWPTFSRASSLNPRAPPRNVESFKAFPTVRTTFENSSQLEFTGRVMGVLNLQNLLESLG